MLPTRPRTDIRVRKFPRVHPPFKENIHLPVRPSLRLRQPEIRPDKTQETHARPEKTSLPTPIPGRGIKHIRHNNTIQYAHDVVHVSGDDNRFGLEPRGWDLGDETVADGADGDVVGEGVDEEETADTPACSFAVGDGDEANEEEEEGEECEAVDV